MSLPTRTVDGADFSETSVILPVWARLPIPRLEQKFSEAGVNGVNGVSGVSGVPDGDVLPRLIPVGDSVLPLFG